MHQSVLLKFAAVRFVAWTDFARHFGAEAILTVSHGVGWITAAALARELGVPLDYKLPLLIQHWDRYVCDAIRRMAMESEDIVFLFPVHPNPHLRSVVTKLLGK